MEIKDLIADFKQAGFKLEVFNHPSYDFNMYNVFSGEENTGVILIEEKDQVRVSVPMNQIIRSTFEVTERPLVEDGVAISFGMYTILNAYAKENQEGGESEHRGGDSQDRSQKAKEEKTPKIEVVKR